jgi:light-regulated signal transduction histidine kinase (bacteriophytochrome)
MDTTEAKQAEENITRLNDRLLKMNKELESVNAELKTFNSIAANDFNEMLKSLYISLEMIVTNDARNLSNTGRANLRRAQSSIQKMKLLTEDLVSYSRLHHHDEKMERVTLFSILSEIKKEFDHKGIQSDFEASCESLSEVSVYPTLVYLMFHYLIEQTLRTHKKNETVTVSVSCEPSVMLTNEKNSQKKYHVVTIKDNGEGLDEEELKMAFDISYGMYAKNRPGIGLAICKKIMEIHGGFIRLDSEKGKGSSIQCYFPVA